MAWAPSDLVCCSKVRVHIELYTAERETVRSVSSVLVMSAEYKSI